MYEYKTERQKLKIADEKFAFNVVKKHNPGQSIGVSVFSIPNSVNILDQCIKNEHSILSRLIHSSFHNKLIGLKPIDASKEISDKMNIKEISLLKNDLELGEEEIKELQEYRLKIKNKLKSNVHNIESSEEIHKALQIEVEYYSNILYKILLNKNKEKMYKQYTIAINWIQDSFFRRFNLEEISNNSKNKMLIFNTYIHSIILKTLQKSITTENNLFYTLNNLTLIHPMIMNELLNRPLFSRMFRQLLYVKNNISSYRFHSFVNNLKKYKLYYTIQFRNFLRKNNLDNSFNYNRLSYIIKCLNN